jgi:hypothetical protein
MHKAKTYRLLGMVIHACHSSARDGEAEDHEFKARLGSVGERG